MRVDGWERVLAEAVDEARGRAFAWSVFDCMTWAFDVRMRLTGIDAARQWRGKYKTLAGGLRLLKRLGHDSFADLLTAECGPSVPALMARRGDLVLVARVDAPDVAAGVCVGAQVATVTEGAGLVFVPLSLAVAAWRV